MANTLVSGPEGVRILVAELAEGERLASLDVGSKTIGVALSDGQRIIASPHLTVRRRRLKDDVAALTQTFSEQSVGGAIVGLPVNMNGGEGPRCQSVRQFAADLRSRTGIALALWDERLSTAAVTRCLIGADLSRRRRSQLVDKLAAAYILQGALDFLAKAPVLR